MRQETARILYELMKKNLAIWIITADLGYGLWDKIRDEFPDRFINTGASEQAASDICVGLALEGKQPWMYTITPFYYRCFETLRTYIDHEKINVKLIGSGRDNDYIHDGFSHDATDAGLILGTLGNIQQAYPDSIEQLKPIILSMSKSKLPAFLSLRR